MDLSLSMEQDNLKKTARKFLTDLCPYTFVREMEEDEKGFSLDLWQKMAKLGWQGIVIPEEFGGAGMGFFELVVLLEEMGRACLPGPFFCTVALGGLLIQEFGNDRQKRELLSAVSKGEAVLTLAHSEPACGWFTDKVEMEAKPRGQDYVIRGTKLFVPYAHAAQWMIVSVQVKGKVSLFLLKSPAAGIKCTQLETLAYDKQAEVVFEDVLLKRDNLIGKLGQGNTMLQKIQLIAAVAKCAEMVGGAQRVLEMTIQYAKEREQFGHPIGAFQAIQHYCADMVTDVDSSRLMTYEAAWRISEGLPFSREAAMAKAWVGEAYQRVTNLGVQIHGGIGFSIEHNMQLYYRRAKEAEVFAGDPDAFREKVAQELVL